MRLLVREEGFRQRNEVIVRPRPVVAFVAVLDGGLQKTTRPGSKLG